MSSYPRDERSKSNFISAGIGVGTGIASAGLTLLLAAAVVFFRRRKQRHPDPAPPTPALVAQTSSPALPTPEPVAQMSPPALPTPEPVAQTSPPALPTPEPVAQTSSPKLPTPVPEKSSNVPNELSLQELGAAISFTGLPNRFLWTGSSNDVITDWLNDLGSSIRHHVRHSYHLGSIPETKDDLHASLSHLKPKLKLSEDTCRMVADLAIDPSTRHLAIRHLLTFAIFSNLDTHSVSKLSLLPPTVKELFQSLPRVSTMSRCSSFETALVSWKRITAFLMHHDTHGKGYLQLLPSAESQVEDLVDILHRFLIPFIDRYYNESLRIRRGHLKELIMECVKFGYDVFAQPCDWHFTFPEQENGVVLVLPGLERHSGNLGEIYESPMMIQLPQVIPSTKIKHYFLAPNFDTEAPPKGPIHLGSILYNLTDFKPLEEEVKEIPPDQYYPIDEKPGFEISLDQLHSADRDLRARALKLLGLGTDPSTKRTKGSNQVISCQRLETHTFKATDSYIQAAIKADDNINSFLRLGIFKRSVYMVTGLKIAYSASQTSSTTRTTVDAGLDPSAIPVHLGTGFGFENSHKVGKSLRASKPIIVAFKVKKIWLNCLDRKAVMMVDGSFGHYEPVITMLSDDELALEEVNELFGKYGDDI